MNDGDSPVQYINSVQNNIQNIFMQKAINFQEHSYEQHKKEFLKYSLRGDKAAHAKTWLENDTVDAWRHQRMYKMIDPILYSEPNTKWLTVGDGRYGKDAKYIMTSGCYALATDISDILLKEGVDSGYISEYKQENAESLSFNDLSFDYVFCKESYHHFPRPMIALYEMLRVSSKGVILIEPNDKYINDNISEILFRTIRQLIKKILGLNVSKHGFEDSGNYVFRISKREIEKVALGLSFNVVAFKGINDAYYAGVEYEKFSDNGPLKRKVKGLIIMQDFLCKLGLINYGLLAAILFKKKPSTTLIKELANDGYEILNLPDNPYTTI